MTRDDDFRRLRALLNHKWVTGQQQGFVRNHERDTFEKMLNWLNEKPERQLAPHQRVTVEQRCRELDLL